MHIFKDVATVAGDVADVPKEFGDAPAPLRKAFQDTVLAVVHRDPIAVAAAIDELKDAAGLVRTDAASAVPAFDKLQADVQKLLADLS